jgi:hypothetical protein
MTDLPLPKQKFFLPDLLMTLFLRLVALGCLWYALKLWGQLIGYSDAGTLRFDLLPTDLKAADAMLAVLYPVAAIGLWLRGAWGPVIWTAAAALEVTMHEILIDTFGGDPVKIMAIALVALIYLILRLTIVFLKPARTATLNG